MTSGPSIELGGDPGHEQLDVLEDPYEDAAKELARLRKENEVLRQEREILKKTSAFFAEE